MEQNKNRNKIPREWRKNEKMDRNQKQVQQKIWTKLVKNYYFSNRMFEVHDFRRVWNVIAEIAAYGLKFS